MQSFDHINFIAFTGIFWFIFWIYWITAAKNPKSVRRQNHKEQAFILIRLAVCFALVYMPQFSLGWLGYQLIVKGVATGLAGNFICAIGLLFAVWARRTINSNWNDTTALTKRHKLVQQGPYRLVRHPIYTGLLLIWLGSAITLGEARGFLALVITFWGLWNKLQQEEALLCQQYPIRYPEYKQKVKTLIPFLL